MAMNLTNQVRSIAEVTKAVAGGDLTKRITVDVRGEMLDLKETVNGMTESLSVFANEVTRVAREVGTEGKLGGQAKVENVSGTWKVSYDFRPWNPIPVLTHNTQALTDNVNTMADNVCTHLIGNEWALTISQLTLQVRTIAVATVKNFFYHLVTVTDVLRRLPWPGGT